MACRESKNPMDLCVLEEILLFLNRWGNGWAQGWYNHVFDGRMDYRMRCAPPREENFNNSNTFFPQYVNENPLSTSKVGAAGLRTGTCAHTVHTNELPNWSLCTQCDGIWECHAGREKEEQVAGPEITVPLVMPTRHRQQDFWHHDLLALQHLLLSVYTVSNLLPILILQGLL